MDTMKLFALVMVDDEDNCAMVKDAIEEASLILPVTLSCLHDGVELLEYLKNQNAEGGTYKLRPDLILLDLWLPKLDGLETLKEIRSIRDFRCLPVVVFSASVDHQTVEMCYENGAKNFIEKPSRFEDLVEIIKSLVHTGEGPVGPNGHIGSCPF